jgi:hypothetical protein
MRNFFRSLDRERVHYLLISGQACVLYGASQFTEDIDLWIRPTPGDVAGLKRALGSVGARVHKLTPPLRLSFVRRGHGFHFLIPPDTYLDVMGRPPRVGPFAKAWRRSRRIATDWGRLPVVAPEDLVLLKQTNRPSDYEAISNLARMRVGEAPEEVRVLDWAMRHSFDVDDLYAFARSASRHLWRWPERRSLRALRRVVLDSSALPAAVRRETALHLASELAALQERGRRYWIPILRELKELHAKGGLIPPGTPVRTLS